MALRIIHLFSDWKWKGAAVPTVSACDALAHMGHHVVLGHTNPDNSDEDWGNLAQRAIEKGLKTTDKYQFDYQRDVIKTFTGLCQFPRYLQDEDIQVIHTHLRCDHLMGGLSRIRVRAAKPPVLIRTFHSCEVSSFSHSRKFLLRKITDGVLTVSEDLRQQFIDRFAFNPDAVAVSPFRVDYKRFDPKLPAKNMRPTFNLTKEDVVIGMVGGWEERNKIELFIEAAKWLLKEMPKVKFLIIGEKEEVLKKSFIKDSGILEHKDNFRFAGFRTVDYVDTLAAIDIFVMVRPATDGSAGTLREAMSLGIPPVVTEFGVFADIVDNHKNGIVVTDNNPMALKDGILKFINNPDMRKEVGKNASAYVRDRFNLKKTGSSLEEFYKNIISLKKY